MGDEIHMLLVCPELSDVRATLEIQSYIRDAIRLSDNDWRMAYRMVVRDNIERGLYEVSSLCLGLRDLKQAYVMRTRAVKELYA